MKNKLETTSKFVLPTQPRKKIKLSHEIIESEGKSNQLKIQLMKHKTRKV